jgi:Carboxypeptidase regulatory-like domain
LEYAGSSGAWAIDPTIYDVGTKKYNIGSFSGTNSRGGIAWAYSGINIFNGTITGHENFIMMTGDALRLDSSFAVYGLQFSPSSGGGAGGPVASNSLIADLDYDAITQDKGTYGDVDIRRSLTTTAAEVSVTGRVTNGSGTGMPGVSIVMTGTDGVSRTAFTSPLGYYRFDNIPVGDTYVMTPSAKRTRFSTQVINVQDEMNDVNFTPNQQ